VTRSERVLLKTNWSNTLRGNFSPDGRRLGMCDESGQVHVWVCESAREYPQFDLGGPLDPITLLDWDTALSWTKDGRCVLLSREGVRAVEVLSMRLRWVIPGTLARTARCAQSPDGRLLALGNDEGAIVLHDAISGAEVVRWHADHGSVH